ncbi:MAG: GIY-YIG nuclease family protein [Phycisphaeraceae bacterium]|nr:GIY-YIG nuclease family protein [Phycisphaeraceae bacterium]
MKLDELREEILGRIRDCAAGNGGRAPSREEFTKTTKIGIAKWKGVLWRSWGDALIEAGFKPDARRKSDAEMLEEYGKLALELCRVPTSPDLRLAGKQGKKVSNWNTLRARFGGRRGLNASLVEYWKGREESQLIRGYCGKKRTRQTRRGEEPLVPGWVYLMESGGIYKIGRAVNVEHRHKEVETMTPHDLVILHRIKTDDSVGIEAYWHKRFESKWVKGEWFSLNDEDVKVMRERVVM